MNRAPALILTAVLALGASGCGKSQATIDSENLWTVTFRCKEAIKEAARDPDSVVFEDDRAEKVPGGWLVTVKFRAKNGFGGYERTARACVFDARGQVTAILKA
jgi:hypothetical protein